jgi:hypothetical protein
LLKRCFSEKGCTLGGNATLFGLSSTFSLLREVLSRALLLRQPGGLVGLAFLFRQPGGLVGLALLRRPPGGLFFGLAAFLRLPGDLGPALFLGTSSSWVFKQTHELYTAARLLERSQLWPGLVAKLLLNALLHQLLQITQGKHWRVPFISLTQYFKEGRREPSIGLIGRSRCGIIETRCREKCYA